MEPVLLATLAVAMRLNIVFLRGTLLARRILGFVLKTPEHRHAPRSSVRWSSAGSGPEILAGAGSRPERGSLDAQVRFFAASWPFPQATSPWQIRVDVGGVPAAALAPCAPMDWVDIRASFALQNTDPPPQTGAGTT